MLYRKCNAEHAVKKDTVQDNALQKMLYYGKCCTKMLYSKCCTANAVQKLLYKKPCTENTVQK